LGPDYKPIRIASW